MRAHFLIPAGLVVCALCGTACDVQPEMPLSPCANLVAVGCSLPVADKEGTPSLGALHNIALDVLATTKAKGTFRTPQEFLAHASEDLARVLAVDVDFWDVAQVERMLAVLRENRLSSPFGPFDAFDPWRVAEFLSVWSALSAGETQGLNRFLDLAVRLDHRRPAAVLRTVEEFARECDVAAGDGSLLADVIDIYVHSYRYWYAAAAAPGKDADISPLLDDPMVPLVDVLFTILGSKLTTPIGGALIGALASAMYIEIQTWEPTGDPGGSGYGWEGGASWNW